MNSNPWRRILAATDFSPVGDEAVNYAHALAEQCGAELHVIHLARDQTEVVAMHGISGILESDGEEDERSDWLKSILGDKGNVRRIQVVEFGHDVAGKVTGYAGKNEIDLIVVASHGRTGLERLWLGSNAEKVIRSAPCPVLVLRP